MQYHGLFSGKYEIVGKLREGGMGEVFLALQHPLGRRVVLKTIRSALVPMPEAAPMFLDEARVLSQISHPNVVRLYDFGQWRGLVGASSQERNLG